MSKRIGNYVGFSTFLEFDGGNKGIWNLIDQFYFRDRGEWAIPFSATGGTVTEPGNGYKYHTFTSSGTFTVSKSGSVEVFTIGGGGGGGNRPSGNSGGGGGAGGLVHYFAYPVSVSPGQYTVTIGGGGSGSGTDGPGSAGTNSSFGPAIGLGGAGGAGFTAAAPAGGCGGGGGGVGGAGGAGNGGTGLVLIRYVL